MIMSNKTYILLFILLISGGRLVAQNITDQAVTNDRSADGHITQSDYSTVDDSVFLHPERIKFDDRCIQIDGKDQFILSGTFHYFRTPKALWRDRLQKLKDCGFNCVETYVPWNWHERRMPSSVVDESKLDMQPLEDFLSLVDSMGLYSIIRPGPYICSEWSGGGFPQWLMRKKPAHPRFEVWLQSNDPVFMQWNEHWYKAVCRVVAPHQIHRRHKGQGGVIFFQVENEFNRIKWFPKEVKKDYLEQLTQIARRNGIDVPILTCWTTEARNVGEGPLNGIVDMVNSYPRWQIEKNFGRLINQQLKTQPGKPLISGELQGGWYSGVGERLSWQQEGVSAVQTQNITLYALQRGFCALNFYMAVGGTNFDDWAARGVTTTYDFAAAIGEDGSTNERYERLRCLAPFLMEHGTHIARAKEMFPSYSTTDSTVMLTLRQALNGDRYYFIRTEDYLHAHSGTLQTENHTFDFTLEPFGSIVYYIPNGQQEGVCLPTALETVRYHKASTTTIIEPKKIFSFTDPLPKRWKRLPLGKTLEEVGILGHHPIYYKTSVLAGDTLFIGRTGKGVVNGTDADEVMVSVNGQLLSPVVENEQETGFLIPANLTNKKHLTATILFMSLGLHHHTNLAVEQHWTNGLECVRQRGHDLPLEYALTEPEQGQRYSSGLLPKNSDARYRASSKADTQLSWHIFTFDSEETTAPLCIRFKELGDGFVYVNGHAIGRIWSAGPQQDYYIPECWLNPDGKNVVALSILNKR